MPDLFANSIQTLRIDVAFFGAESDGFFLQNQLSTLCRDWLSVSLEHLLEYYAPPWGNLTIEYLEIDAGTLSLDRIEQDFVESVLKPLQITLKDAVSNVKTGNSASVKLSQGIKYKTNESATWEAFLHFLATGRLPWAFQVTSGKNLGEMVLEALSRLSASQLQAELREVLRTHSRAGDRLSKQFNPLLFQTLAEQVSPKMTYLVVQVIKNLQPFASSVGTITLEQIVWLSAFRLWANTGSTDQDFFDDNGNLLAESLLEANRRHLPINPIIFTDTLLGDPEQINNQSVDVSNLPVTDFREENIADTQKSLGLPGEGIWIELAGLVILAPFLPQFFQSLGLSSEKVVEKPDRALQLLYFLATGQSFAPEYELTFAKMLCGIPLDQPIEGHIQLSDNEIAESNHLLDTVIRYWDALKGTSRDGLREAFLRRAGKLTYSDSIGWTLHLEKKTLDILLQQLPWGVSIIQLPWMPALLHVEWEY
jgi:hypothetical protein